MNAAISPMSRLIKHILGLIFFIGTTALSAQVKPVVTVVDADQLLFEKNVIDAQRLLGSVVLKYGDVFLRCDSAHLFASQDFDAFGKVRINQGDTLHLSGDLLHFNKATSIANMRDNIRLKNDEMTLTTDFLDYNMDQNLASFWNGGKIVSTENKNTLTSESGTYDVNSARFHFRKNVVLQNPEYTVHADTLIYGDKVERAWFKGPTTIDSKDAKIYCENGWFDTLTQMCQFNENAHISSGATTMAGDSISYNGQTGSGEVFCNVVIQDTTSNYVISGDYGWHSETEGKSFVTKRALMTQVFDTDSLTLHADTLMALTDTLGMQTIHAYHGVRFFKPDLQGIADSLTYSEKDSLLTLYRNPIVWSDENQITGDTIQLLTYDGKIQKLFVHKNSFVASEAAPGKYNQIKGLTLVGSFVDNRLQRIDVNGNGQVVYFPLDGKSADPKTIGVNNAACSNLSIYVEDNKIQRVSMINAPSGALHPNSLANKEDKELQGFSWNSQLRPRSIGDLFKNH